MVFNIIKDHKGWIDVSSEVGKGTAFQIYLSALSKDQAQEKNSKEIPAPVLQTGNETVLFVDDEENIRNMGKAFLQRLGYRVLLARDGEEAAKQ
ncbi:MAG: hybrid sensor histidine kinase/response regulator, partial [Candidatus Omnitrophica bacterium CG07_land_8_20_14_0_80_50_8]